MIEALWFCNILLFISTVLLLIDSGRLIEELKIQKMSIDKFNSSYSDKRTNFYASAKKEVLDSYKVPEVYLDEVKPLSAVGANKLKQKSVTQAEVDALLKPVFDKVVKASEKGDSEIFLSGSDWYHCKNEKYKTATQQLTALGYSVWRDNNGFGVRVKW